MPLLHSYNDIKPPFGLVPGLSNPLSDGLIGSWLLNEGAGGTVFDSSLYNNLGVIDDATWAIGRNGWALDFDGTDDSIDIPDGVISVDDYPWSVSIWLKHDAVHTDPDFNDTVGIVDSKAISPGGSSNFWIGLRDSDYEWRYQLGSGDGIRVLTPQIAGEWVHLVGVVTSTNIYLYKNGVLASSGAHSKSFVTFNSNDLQVGVWGGTVSFNYFDGLIGEINLYERGLLASEVTQLFTNSYTRFQQFKLSLGLPSVSTNNIADIVLEATPDPVAGIWGDVTVIPVRSASFILKGEKLLIPTASDTVSISEDDSLNTGFFQGHSETGNISDAIGQLFFGFFNETTEAQNIDETDKTLSGFIVGVDGAINVDESLGNLLGSIKSQSHVINIDEVIRSLRGPILAINEVENIIELSVFLLGSTPTINESVNIDESIRDLSGPILFVEELVNLSDAYRVMFGFFEDIAEIVNIDEADRIMFGFFEGVNGTVNIVDDIVTAFVGRINLFKAQLKSVTVSGVLESLKVSGVLGSIKQSFKLKSLKVKSQAKETKTGGILDSSLKQNGKLDKDKVGGVAESLKVKSQAKETKTGGILDSSLKQNGKLDKDKTDGEAEWTG